MANDDRILAGPRPEEDVIVRQAVIAFVPAMLRARVRVPGAARILGPVARPLRPRESCSRVRESTVWNEEGSP